ncbi:Glutathione synthase/RimK-type ligase, ATP-grasp superfamily [Pelomyxa schiedti]|nr:Glutathione synthase/RimK-type ligase, ATP-grasp superfamily [Pelomyxa schiedti]
MKHVCLGSSDEALEKPDIVTLSEQLKEKNARVTVVDWRDQGVDYTQFDCVVIRTTWNYTSYIDEFVQWVRRVCEKTCLLNSMETILWNIDKVYLRDLAEEGVSVVPTVWIDKGSVKPLHTVFEEQGWDTVVIKPRISAEGYNTHCISTVDMASGEQIFSQLVSERDMMVQQFMETVKTCGELSLVFIGGKYSHSLRKRASSSDFRVQESHGGSTILEHNPPQSAVIQAQEILKTAWKVVNRRGNPHSGRARGTSFLYARVDFLTASQRPSTDYGMEATPPTQFLLTELELLEPSLYPTEFPPVAQKLADEILTILGESP